MSSEGAYGEKDEWEEGEGGDEEVTRKSPNDHVILLVDARKSMFEKLQDGSKTFFGASMELGVQLMKNKVIASNKHRVGVTLFGTRKTSDMEELNKNVYVSLELAIPSAKRIRDLEKLAQGEVNFESKYGSQQEGKACPLRAGLWSCTMELNAVKDPNDFKRIWIFTNDDCPNFMDDTDDAGDCRERTQEEQKRVQRVAKDATEAGVEIQLFHMNPSKGKRFNPNEFYSGILAGDGDDFNDQVMDGGVDGFSELMDRVRLREFKKRALGRLPMFLSEGGAAPAISFAVQIFCMIHIASRPTPINLDARNNKPVQVVTKMMDDLTGAQLEDYEVRTYLEFCGEKAYITKAEMEGMKGLTAKGLTVLSFRPLSSLRPDYNIQNPYFIYPDEHTVKGSANAFIALHAAMLQKGVYALARFARISGASPRLVALIAQEEETEGGLQLSPPGLNMIPLPFADEVREPLNNEEKGSMLCEVKEESQTAAENVVKALGLAKVECRRFQNPALQRHYAALQAIALSEEDIEWDPNKNDTTRPDNEALDAIAGEALDAFRQSFGGDEPDDTVGGKRKAGTGSGDSVLKKAKGDSHSKVDWKAAAEKREVDEYTMPMLKAYLKSVGLPLGGKKADLVARVTNHALSA